MKGDDAALTRLIEPLNVGGFYHALSVAVLGSYIGNFAGGDPSRAPEFSLEDAIESDPKARRLGRILEQYAKVLTAAERDLLARLSLFPRGVKVELLGWIVQSGGEVAGALVGMADNELVKHLEKLKALGLVFRYETDRQAVYSAHPFLRESFRNFLGTKPESVHESVRAKLAPSLEARPSTKPSDPAILDQYELLIEEALLAGRVQDAFDLYYDSLGGDNLSSALGENGRGLRILERFVPQDDFALIELHLPLRDRSVLVADLGSFAKNLGDLGRAREALRYSLDLNRSASDQAHASRVAQNLAAVEQGAGHFLAAFEYAGSAVSLAQEANADTEIMDAPTYRAAAQFALGSVASAAADFQRASELLAEPLLTSAAGIWEAEYKLICGNRSGALGQTNVNREVAAKNSWNDTLCHCNALLTRLLLPGDPAQAARHLQDARAFADRSGTVELQLCCFHAACELHRHLGDYPQAITEAEAGILLADTCGFGKYSIDLHFALAETYLLVLLCYKRTIWCRIVSWAKTARQAHRNNALRHISRAWRKPQGTLTETFR